MMARQHVELVTPSRIASADFKSIFTSSHTLEEKKRDMKRRSVRQNEKSGMRASAVVLVFVGG